MGSLNSICETKESERVENSGQASFWLVCMAKTRNLRHLASFWMVPLKVVLKQLLQLSQGMLAGLMSTLATGFTEAGTKICDPARAQLVEKDVARWRGGEGCGGCRGEGGIEQHRVANSIAKTFSSY